MSLEKFYPHFVMCVQMNFTMTSLFPGPVASLINHKLGFRVTIFLGGAIGGIGLLLCSFSTDFYMVLMTFGIIAGK